MRNGEFLFSTVPVGDGNMGAPVFRALIASKGIDVHSRRRDLFPERGTIAVKAPHKHSGARRFEVVAIEPNIGSRIGRSILPRLVPRLFSIVSPSLDDPTQRFLGAFEAFACLIEF